VSEKIISKVICIRLSQEEYQELLSFARASGMKKGDLSPYLRKIIMEHVRKKKHPILRWFI
jgi:hypothetical protein